MQLLICLYSQITIVYTISSRLKYLSFSVIKYDIKLKRLKKTIKNMSKNDTNFILIDFYIKLFIELILRIKQ